tara:strand:+ start:130 stop:528 length:399 start_codon:yes stop_codon:yes gene_type:complete
LKNLIFLKGFSMSETVTRRRPFPVEATNLEVTVLQQRVMMDFATQGPIDYMRQWLGSYKPRVERHRAAAADVTKSVTHDETLAIATIDGVIAHVEIMLKADPEDIRDYSATIMMITTAIIYSREMQNSGLWT